MSYLMTHLLNGQYLLDQGTIFVPLHICLLTFNLFSAIISAGDDLMKIFKLIIITILSILSMISGYFAFDYKAAIPMVLFLFTVACTLLVISEGGIKNAASKKITLPNMQ